MESQNQILLPWIELECTKLPSRGLPYPSGAKVKYRTFTHGEVRNASISTFDLSKSLELALTGIEAVGFDKNKLTLQDALYLGLLRKSSTMSGMQMEFPYVCQKCEKENKKIFTERDIEFQDISDEVSELPISTDISGKVVEFTPMTVKQFIDYERGVYNQFTKGKKQDVVGVEALMVSNMSFKEAYELIYNLKDQDDLDVLDDIDKLMLHDIKRLEAVCNNTLEDKTTCNHKNLVRLEGREGLLRPFREGDRNTRTRIRLSKEQHSECLPDSVS